MKRLRLYKDREAFADEVVKRAFQYEAEVKNGERPAVEWIHKAVKRSVHLREKYSYQEEALKRVAYLFYYMYIPVNDRPTQFLPDKWQCWILMNLFAIIVPDTNKRLFQEALVFVARKSGKTMFGAALALIFTMKYGGMMAQCFGAATVQDQAKQLMLYSKIIVRNSPSLKKRIKQYRDELHYDDGNSNHSLVQLSEQQADRADGKNPSFCLYDEAHAFKTDALKEVIITGMGARSNPLFLTVTTAGFLTVGYPLYTQVQLARKVLIGEVEDDATFYALYCMNDEKEPLECPIEDLEKANPGLGTAVSLERLEQMRKKAKLLPSTWRHFLVKNCNIFQVELENPFISDKHFLGACGAIDYNALRGGRAWIGIDLSKRIDLAAFSVLIEHPETKTLHLLAYHFFPGGQENKKVRPSGVDLTTWIKSGHIIEHDDRIDLDNVYEYIATIYEDFEVQFTGYDPYHARKLVSKIKANLDWAHIPIKPVAQNITTMSPPSQYFEDLVVTQNINLGENPVLRYCNSNAHIKYSATSSLIRVVKNADLDPIDSIISSIVAVACYMETEFSTLTELEKQL